MKLPKAARLRRRREFLLVQQRGTRLYAGDVLVLALDSGRSPASHRDHGVVQDRERGRAQPGEALGAGGVPRDAGRSARDGLRRDRSRGGARRGGRAGVRRGLEAARTASRPGGARDPAGRSSSSCALYQGLVSPLLPRACRFYPSCSAYAATALERHGALKGSASRRAAPPQVPSLPSRRRRSGAGVREVDLGSREPSSPHRHRPVRGGPHRLAVRLPAAEAKPAAPKPPAAAETAKAPAPAATARAGGGTPRSRWTRPRSS